VLTVRHDSGRLQDTRDKPAQRNGLFVPGFFDGQIQPGAFDFALASHRADRLDKAAAKIVALHQAQDEHSATLDKQREAPFVALVAPGWLAAICLSR
jgi:hypothetical protein